MSVKGRGVTGCQDQLSEKQGSHGACLLPGAACYERSAMTRSAQQTRRYASIEFTIDRDERGAVTGGAR